VEAIYLLASAADINALGTFDETELSEGEDRKFPT
jgi:hypothetical protein